MPERLSCDENFVSLCPLEKMKSTFMIDLSKIVDALLERLEQVRIERPSAGTKYRLMGIALDIGELTQQMKDEVLEKVSREIVLDADADIDYDEMSQQILTKELEENAVQDEIRVQQGVVNQALAALSDMMDKIAAQLTPSMRKAIEERLGEP